MVHIGEGINIPIQRLENGECVVCGKVDHDNIKKDEIKPTGWKRAQISGVGGRFASKKLSCYPNNSAPPTVYRSEGHHCLAFSSFIKGASASPPNPTDRFATLNFYLQQKNYDPNNINNRIDLPGRKQKDNPDPKGQFTEFTLAVDNKKPLQLHIGGHSHEFMNASNVLLRDILRTIQQNSVCKKPDEKFKETILKKVQDAEDKAFKKTAGAIMPWVCHPAPLRAAESYAKKELNVSADITYPKI